MIPGPNVDPLPVTPDSFEQTLAPLWLRAQSGDEDAYRQALQLRSGRVRAYLRRRAMDPKSDVEDLVQEVLLAVHLQRGTHIDGLPVSHWVIGIARYKWIDYWRRRGRRVAVVDDPEALDQLPAADDAGPAEARRDLGGLLLRLPMAQRRAIELLKLEGLTAPEAARAVGVSESAIKVQAHRGLQRLATMMRGEHED
jgi:RNA polymerase sigma-70 factor (ECF subfamily)